MEHKYHRDKGGGKSIEKNNFDYLWMKVGKKMIKRHLENPTDWIYKQVST